MVRHMRLWTLLLGLSLWAAAAQAQEGAPACAALARAMGDAPGARFLASYPTSTDPAIKDAAFLYDNAAAAIALVGCGERAKAARIGDAILLTLAHDRYWRDGRLRNAYLAGRMAAEPVKLPGWWDKKQNRWVEDRYQAGSDTGNMAWTMLALLALDEGAPDGRYRDGAAKIGAWLARWRSTTGPGGFTGGALGHEPEPVTQAWKSTEHNADLAAAFSALARRGDKAPWDGHGAAAARFVRAMWNDVCRCFAAGTGADGITPNPLLALDAQVWPLLAMPHDAAQRMHVIGTAQTRLSNGEGFSYSEAAGGFWTEGTAQMALLLRLSGEEKNAGMLMRAIEDQRSESGFYNAADATLATGLAVEADPSQTRHYFRMPHLGATAWVALAQQRFNPFTYRRALP